MSHVSRVLEDVGALDGLEESCVDVSVLHSKLRARLTESRKGIIPFHHLKFLRVDRRLGVWPKVTLCSHEDYRSGWADISNLGLPSLKRFGIDCAFVVEGDAEHEAVGLVVGNLPVGAEEPVTTRIVEFKHHLLALVGFGSSENIKHCWLVVFVEDLIFVLVNQTRLTDSSVTHEHNL